MTLSEFKTWFEGFIESVNNTPTEAQWKRIKARVKEIDGSTTIQGTTQDFLNNSAVFSATSAMYAGKLPYRV